MEVRIKLSLIFVAAAVLAVAQNSGFYLRDASGKSSISHFTSVKTTLRPDGKTGFLVLGNPFQAQWTDMSVKAKRIEGVAVKLADQSSVIDQATISGGVVAVATRPSRKRAAPEPQTITIDTASLEYTRSNERLTFPTSVTVNQQDKAAGQSFLVKGQSGWVDLYPPQSPSRSKQALQSMRLEGPVSFELRSMTKVEDPENPGKELLKPFVITGKGRLLTYDDVSRKMTLDREVEIDGTHPSLIGNMVAKRAVLTLDENWNPIEIELVGEPGVSRFDEPPKPKGRKA